MSDGFEERFREALNKADERFRGEHKGYLKDLLGLSKTEIDSITPDNIDLLEYERLMAVVRAATDANLSNVALMQRIKQLGGTAIKIAKLAGIPI